MQAGIRARIARMARRVGPQARQWSPPALVALLSSGALAPVVVALAAGPPVAVASAGVVGSVGANVLSRVVEDAVRRVRSGGLASDDGDGSPSTEQVEEHLSALLAEQLEAGGPGADRLKHEIVALLTRIGAPHVGLRAALETRDAEVIGHVTMAFTSLASDVGELRETLDEALAALASEVTGFRVDVAGALREIQDQLRDEQAHQRAVLTMSEQVLTYLMRLHDLTVRSGVARQPPAAGDRPATADDDGPGGGTRVRWTGSPYRGLLPFGQEHQEIFFGREQVTAELLHKLAERLTGPGLVVVTGASGVGKSSLLGAGLLPALARGTLPVAGSERWPRVLLTPTARPLDELATHLAVVGHVDVGALRDALAREPEQAHRLVRQALLAHRERAGNQAGGAAGGLAGEETGGTAGEGRLVLVVDQFEQALAPGHDGAARPESEAFITALVSAATTPSGPAAQPPALVVLAVRGDYLDSCSASPRLADILQGGLFIVGPMREAELRQAITGPAVLAGLQIDDDLVEIILGDLRARRRGDFEPSALPLLSQAMYITWRQREGTRLTRRSYGSSGGIVGAVRLSAEEAYAGLTGEQRDLAREVFLQLADVDAEGTVTRRARDVDDLRSGSGVPVPAPVPAGDGSAPTPAAARVDDLARVLAVFTDRRLLVRSAGEPDDPGPGPGSGSGSGSGSGARTRDGEPDGGGRATREGNEAGRVEIAHDSLLEAWPRLRRWLEEVRDALAQHSRLIDRANLWIRSGHDASYLYRGAALASARQLIEGWKARAESLPPFDEGARSFVVASIAADARRRRLSRTVITAVAVVVVLALVSSALFVYQRRVARAEATASASRALASLSADSAGTDLALSMMQALAAYETEATPEAENALFRHYRDHRTAAAVLSGVRGNIAAVDASADGRVIAATTPLGLVTVWSRRGGRLTTQHLPPEMQASSIDVTNDGDGLLMVGSRSISFYDVAAGRRRWTLPDVSPADVDSVVVRDDGTTALLRGEGTANRRFELWEPAGRSARKVGERRAPETLDSYVEGFGPEPDTVILAEYIDLDQRRLVLWDAASGEETPVGDPDALVWLGEGGRAVFCRDRTLSVVDLGAGPGGPPQAGQAGQPAQPPVGTVELPPDPLGSTEDCPLVVGDATGEVVAGSTEGWVADLRTGELVVPPATGDAGSAVAVLVDGERRLLMSHDDTTIFLTEIATDSPDTITMQWLQLLPAGDRVVGVSGDGGRIVTATTSTRVAPADQVASRRRPEPQLRSAAPRLAINQDGSLVADRVGHDTVQVRSLPDLRLVSEVTTEPVSDDPNAPGAIRERMGFAGRHLVTVAGPVAQWWDPATGDLVEELDAVEDGFVGEGDEDGVTWGLPPDHQFAAIAVDTQAEVQLIDIGTRRRVDTISLGRDIVALQFQPGSDHVALLRHGSLAEVWDSEEERRLLGPFPIGVVPNAETFVAELLPEPGELLVAHGGRIRWYRAGSAAPTRSLELGGGSVEGTPRQPVSLSGDGNVLLYVDTVASESPGLGLVFGYESEPSPVALLDLRPSEWRSVVCDLLRGRTFTDEERAILPDATTDRPLC